ncbi:MAG: SGNH/GDSL hydrolase family protein, partial [Planctomycetales bacterium]
MFMGTDSYIQIADQEVELNWQEANCSYLGANQFPFMDLLTTDDLKPLTQNMVVFGKQKGLVLEAEEIAIEFRPDPRESEDPKLPRVLFIGDSISGNYDRGFRGALEGKANVHHPPANCGPAGNGRLKMLTWLGAYDQPGHQWDVISFNFGQWNVNTSKASYQSDLRAIADMLTKTKAKLIWVTTTPIPGGYGDIAGKPAREDRGSVVPPGKFKGLMRDYINPWAMEVMKEYPQISVCDQHAMLWNEASAQPWLKIAGTNRKGGIVNKEIKEDYGDNHIPGHLSIVIGRQLARLVLDVNGQNEVALNPVEVNPKDFGPEGRAVSRNMDAADFKDLVHNDKRLRKYNTLSTAKK